MYKISWSESRDSFIHHFVLASDVHNLFAIYWVITGYGRGDGVSPIDIKVTNLDGDEVDMSKGLAYAASYGTR